MKKFILSLFLAAVSAGAALADVSVIPYQANPRFIQRKYIIVEEEALRLKRPAQTATVITAYIPNDTLYSTKGHMYSGYPLLDDMWGAKLLNMETAWDFSKGSGVIVAVVDSGVAMTHAELQGNIWTNTAELNGLPGVDDDGNGFVDDVNGWDFVGGDNDPTDLNGHGTHVSGIIGALGGNNKGIIGIAPLSKIMPVRVLDNTGSGFWFNVAQGVRYAANNGARVINLSLGQKASNMLPSDITLIQNAIQYAKGKGAIVVVAAGNDAADISNDVPAKFSEVISVGALRHQYDTVYGSGPLSSASFSNFGAQLDFMAPGVDILSLAPSSTVFAGYAVFTDGTSYYSAADGTSMAAPMVSGLVALMLAQDPLATFDDIYRRLEYSSVDMGAAGFDTTYGYGRVDAFAALTHDYYSDGVVKTLRLLTPDAAGIIRYDYFHSGHVDTALAQNGNVYKFYDDTQRLKSLKDAAGNTLEYYNDAFGTGGQGRISKVTLTDGTEYRLLEYWGNTNTYKKLSYYQSGALVYTRTFYQSGALESITYPDGSINFLYEDTQRLKSITDVSGNVVEYYNDTFGPGGVGRFSKVTLTNGLEYRFTEYWGDTATFKSVDYYQNGVFVVTFHFDVNGNPVSQDLLSNKASTSVIVPSELDGKLDMLNQLAEQKKGLSGEGIVAEPQSLDAKN